MPGIVALIVLIVLTTGILALGRFLPVPLMWGIVSVPFWICIIILSVLYLEYDVEKSARTYQNKSQGKDKVRVKKRGLIYSLYLKIKKKLKEK